MPYTLYRTVRRQRPSVGDFWSDFAHGDPPLRVQLAEPLEWSGISTFSDPVKAMDKARLYAQGRWLAELIIPDNALVLVKQTGRDPHHFSVMGPPAVLRNLVARTLPVA